MRRILTEYLLVEDGIITLSHVPFKEEVGCCLVIHDSSISIIPYLEVCVDFIFVEMVHNGKTVFCTYVWDDN